MYFDKSYAINKVKKACSGKLNHFCLIARSGTDDWLTCGYNIDEPYYGMNSRHAEMDLSLIHI